MAQAKKSKKSVVAKTKQRKAAGRPKTVAAPRKQKAANKSRPPKKIAPPSRRDQLYKLVNSRTYALGFMVFSLVVLLATTVYWSILSANLQHSNADQLIDPYLFQNGQTFHQAIFPGAHSFLLKWPLFWLIHMFKNSGGAYIAATVGLVIVTVATLVAMLYRILGHRRLLFASLCLALASVLLMVPAQPASGALLPVNMAMVATRNLEYVFFIASIFAFIRAQKFRSWWLLAGLILATLLIASDKLFAPLYIAGGLAAIGMYVLTRQARRITQATEIRWLFGGIAATILATVLLKLINGLRITTITAASSASPYALVHSPKQLLDALIYAVGGILTNFGANPAHSVVVVRDLPVAFIHSLGHLSAVAYAVNAALLLVGLVAVWRLGRRYYTQHSDDLPTKLGIALLWVSGAAIVIFIATDHYYPVDARYMTILLFGVFVALAGELRHIVLRPRYQFLILGALLVSVFVGILSANAEYQTSKAALQARSQLNSYVAKTVDHRNIGTLLGNYWYVTPVKSLTHHPLTIVPLASCQTPQPYLISHAWLQAPKHQSVAYLAIKDRGGITYDGCTRQQLTNYYGVPSSTVVVSGNSVQPEQLLLLYKHGVKNGLRGHRPSSPAPLATPTPSPTVQPISVADINDRCPLGTTLNVVAHEDDDLLFMNPDLLHDIQDGICVTTTYLTAGDAGEGASSDYWRNRQMGSEAAYSSMYGVPNDWHQQAVTVGGHQVTADYLNGVPRLTLLFFDLPDGGPHGNGYRTTKTETLNDLRNGSLAEIHSLNGATAFTKEALTAALTNVMNTYQPDQVRTQDYNTNLFDGDHSDHHAAGYFTKMAYEKYNRPSVLKVYAGYPGMHYPANIQGSELEQKTAIFLLYGQQDFAVCQNQDPCKLSPTYKAYLSHQYSKIVAAHVEPE